MTKTQTIPYITVNFHNGHYSIDTYRKESKFVLKAVATCDHVDPLFPTDYFKGLHYGEKCKYMGVVKDNHQDYCRVRTYDGRDLVINARYLDVISYK